MSLQDKQMAYPGNLCELLEEAEIVKTHMELVLMNPHIDPAIRKKYNEAIPLHKNKIKNLKRRIALYRNTEESKKREKIETPVHATGFNFRCAWCDRENGREPQTNDSHGICRMHAKQLKAETIRLQNVKLGSSV